MPACRRVFASAVLVAFVFVGAPGSAQSPPGATVEAVELPLAGGGVLAGTLVRPAGGGRAPVVLLIAGSGPTDRDGNSAALGGKNDSLKMLAEGLAAAGVASLRYDKRGLGGSAVPGLREADVRFETFVADAAAWVTRLRNDPRFTTHTVAGHSEGSLIGLLAARAARADGFVSIAGIARNAADVLRDQLRPQLAALPALWDASEAILAGLVEGRTTGTVPPALVSLYRPSVQPYLISWLRYVPSVEIARLRIPVLIAQGTTDIQVGVGEAEALRAARPDAELLILDGMNHVLKAVGQDRAAQIASYSDPARPVVPELIAAVASFARRVPPLGRRGAPAAARPDAARRSPRTTVFGEVDGARVAIEYGAPSKRDRAIWGALVPWGRVWMPGADESTTLTTRDPLVIGGLSVPPGDWAVYALPAEDAFTLILSRETGQFHTVYHAEQDLGRVPMTRVALDAPVEAMTFAVSPREGGGAVFALRWDDREYRVDVARGPVRD